MASTYDVTPEEHASNRDQILQYLDNRFAKQNKSTMVEPSTISPLRATAPSRDTNKASTMAQISNRIQNLDLLTTVLPDPNIELFDDFHRKDFTPFPKLPIEIRLKIWKLAVRKARTVRLVIEVMPTFTPQGEQEDWWSSNIIGTQTPPDGILHTCRESRGAVIEDHYFNLLNDDKPIYLRHDDNFMAHDVNFSTADMPATYARPPGFLEVLDVATLLGDHIYELFQIKSLTLKGNPQELLDWLWGTVYVANMHKPQGNHDEEDKGDKEKGEEWKDFPEGFSMRYLLSLDTFKFVAHSHLDHTFSWEETFERWNEKVLGYFKDMQDYTHLGSSRVPNIVLVRGKDGKARERAREERRKLE